MSPTYFRSKFLDLMNEWDPPPLLPTSAPDPMKSALLMQGALLALEELLTAQPINENTCESVAPNSAPALLAPSGQCASCDRRRALLNAAKKRRRGK